MKAIVQPEYGSADVLRYTDIAEPTMGERDVLVQVRSSSVNFGDRVSLHGEPRIMRLAFGLRRPKWTVLGRDVAGVVTAVGPKVTRFAVGDEVLGELNQSAFAEYVAAPEAYLARKPSGVSFEQAATLPVAATTALQGLRLAGVTSGQTVLINGATGGVGTFAVQLAAGLNARVTGVASTRNVELVRSLGAERVVDYLREDVTAGSDRFDVIFDLTGRYPLAHCLRVLSPRGVYLASFGTGGATFGPLPRMLTCMLRSPFVGQRLRVFAARRNVEDLDHLTGLVASGALSPVIDQTYPLSRTADAIRYIEREHPRGKVVLTVGPE